MLESLPENCSEEDREHALSEFYKGWLAQETLRQAAYSSGWRQRNWMSIMLGARLQYEKLAARVTRPFAWKSSSTPQNGSRE